MFRWCGHFSRKRQYFISASTIFFACENNALAAGDFSRESNCFAAADIVFHARESIFVHERFYGTAGTHFCPANTISCASNYFDAVSIVFCMKGTVLAW